MRGFSLLQLMIVTVIAATLASVAVPLLRHLVLNQQRRDALNTMLTAVYAGRSAAIHRARPVVLCPVDPAGQCGQGQLWGHTWMLFVNEDNDNPPRLDPGEVLLYQFAVTPAVTVASNRSYYRFQRVGLRSTNGSVIFCDLRGKAHARAVIISYTGRPRVSHTLADGSAIEC